MVKIKKISDLNLKLVTPLKINQTCTEVLAILKQQKEEFLPVLDLDGKLCGLISEKKICNDLTAFKLKIDSPIKSSVIDDFKKLNENEPLSRLSQSFSRHQCVLVTDNKHTKFRICEAKNILDYFMANN